MIDQLKGLLFFAILLGAPAGCVYLIWPEKKVVLPADKYCDAVFAYQYEIVDEINRIDDKLVFLPPENAVGLAWLGNELTAFLINNIDETVEWCGDNEDAAAAIKAALKKDFRKKVQLYTIKAREASGLKEGK
jgi:hypothetical protein